MMTQKKPSEMDMVELEEAYDAADQTAKRCYRDGEYASASFWEDRSADLGAEIDRRDAWIASALARAESPVREVVMYGD